MGWLAEFLILVAYLWGVCPALLGGAFGIAYVWERFSPLDPSIPSGEVADLIVHGSESTNRRRRAA